MKKIIAVLVGVGILSTTGCISSSAKLVRELKGDPAVVSGSVSSVYGTVKFVRVGPQTNNAVSVAPDGTVTLTPAMAK